MPLTEIVRKHSGLAIGCVVGILLLSLAGGDLIKLLTRQSAVSPTEMGRAAGEAISSAVYQTHLNALQGQNALEHANQHSAMTQDRIREQAWRYVVTSCAYRTECKALGLVVTENELIDMVQGEHVHDNIKALFKDKSSGRFDKALLQQYLKLIAHGSTDQQWQWHRHEQYMSLQRQREKLSELIRQSTFVTGHATRDRQSLEKKLLHLEYVYVPYYTAPIEEQEITEAKLQSYLKAHAQTYTTDAYRVVRYIHFPVVPTARDKTLLKEEVQKLKAAFQNASDPADFARLHTDATTQITMRGTFEQLPEALRPFAQRLVRQDVIGPVEEDNCYRLYKCTAAPMKKSVRHYEVVVIEKHLLASDQSRDNAFRQAAHCASLIKNAAQLEQYAAEKQLKSRSVPIKKAYKCVERLGHAPKLVQWSYNQTKVDQVSPVIELDESYVVAVLTERVEKGTAPLHQVREEITLKVRQELQAEAIRGRLNTIKASDASSMAKEYGSEATAAEVKQLHFSDTTLPKAGSAPKVIGAAFALEPGQCTVVADVHGVCWLKNKGHHNQKASVRAEEWLEAEQLKQSYYLPQALEELAQAQDHRYKFY